MRLTGALYDVNNGVGTSGQVLSSTVTGVDWVDISSIGIGGSGTTNYLPKFTAGTTLGNSVLYETTGNVGIGTTAPLSKLGILGNASVGATYGSIAAPTSGMIIEGNVGIGTTGPRTKLDVVGNAPIFDVTGADTALHHLVVSEGTPTDWRSYAGTTTAALQIQTSASRGLVLTPQSSGNTRFMTTNGFDIYTDATLGTNSGTLGMTITNGNVGIGTTSPSGLLHLNSGVNPADSQFLIQANGAGGLSGLAYSADNIQLGFDAYFDGSNSTSLDAGSNFEIRKLSDLLQFRYDSGVALGNSITWETGMVMNTSGNVGIGTTSPGTKLDVLGTADTVILSRTSAGSGSNAGFELRGGATSADWFIGTNRGDITANADDLFIYKNAGTTGAKVTIQDGGNVGIGTTAPLSKLGILGNASVGATYGSIAAPTSGMIIEGNVGIGTTGPSYTLDITGNARFTTGLGLGDEGIPSSENLLYAKRNYTGSSTATGVYGLRYQTATANTNSIIGVKGEGGAYNLGANTLTNAIGVQGYAYLSGTGTITNAYSLFASAPTGTITNAYGLYIGNVTAGSSTNYALYSTGGANYFGGNVGIGRQVLSSTVTGVDWVDISSIGIGGSGTTNYLPKFTAGTTLGNSVLYETNGNVGIGTTGPGAKLEVNGIGQDNIRIVRTNSVEFPLSFYNGATQMAYFDTYGTTWGSIGNGAVAIKSGTGNFTLNQNNVNVLTSEGTGALVNTLYLKAGNVGIGTTGPGYKLDVNNATIQFGDAGTNANLRFNASQRGYLTVNGTSIASVNTGG
ncbi:hypothetical protein HYU91_02355, partial [Candidatus Collierbacteria bacterium]|nr:hypothetical protein [Candidatus Collierbacteria bacterium]